MSLLNFAANVLTRYKADISDHKAALEKLSGEERKAAEARLKQAEQHNATLDGMASKILAVSALVGKAQELINQSVERQQLTAASSFISIDRLRQAAQGLAKETDLMRFAAQAHHGALKADNELIEASIQAMRTLTQRGLEYSKVSDKITEIVLKGEVEGFKELGIVIEGATTKSEQHAAIRQKLIELAEEGESATLSEAESFKAAALRQEEALDKVKEALGRLAIALTPIVELAAKLVGIVADIVSALTLQGEVDESERPVGRSGSWAVRRGPSSTELRMLDVANRLAVGTGERGPKRNTGTATELSDAQIDDLNRLYGDEKPLTPEQKRAIAQAQARALLGRTGRDRTTRSERLGRFGWEALGSEQQDLTTTPWLDDFGREIDLNDRLGWMLEQNSAERATAGFKERLAGYQQRESKLAQMFGPLEEFNAYKKAFDTLAGAVTSSLGAWIDGSKSAAAAFKAFIGESVKSVALQMTVEALKHGAFAIGSLAFGDFAGAATHGKAAAAFAAGAAVAAAAAKGLSGGGDAAAGAGASSGGGGAPAAATGGGAPGEPRPPQIIVIGNSWGRQTPRSQALEAEELVAMAGVGVVN